MSKKPLEIDMIAGSQLRDTQGEMLSVEGADISDLISGNGRLNDNHAKGFFNSIGRVTGAKKIFKAEDCENDRQRYYWEKVKAPFVYVKGVLYDNEEHPNAKAAAAILRNIHRADSPLKLKASVEGGVLARGLSDESLLARTKIHSIALTFTPANNATLVEPLNLEKSDSTWESDRLLIKSVMHLAQTNIPSFRQITRRTSAEKIVENLNKAKEIAAMAGLKNTVPEFTVEELIAQSLEYKITENVKKINELVKGIIPGSTADKYPKTLDALKMDKDSNETMLHHAKLHSQAALSATDPESRKYHNKHADLINNHLKLNKAEEMDHFEKARPDPTKHGYYDINGEDAAYTGKDAKKAQMRVVRLLANREAFPNKPYKRMLNPESGKEELHVAIHRGISNNFDPNAEGKNKIKVSDSHVEQSGHAVHTLYPYVADEYAKKGGQTISFWVPVSKINALAEYHHSGFKDKRVSIPEEMRTHRHMVSPNSPNPGEFKEPNSDWTYNKKIISENKARNELSSEPHSEDQKHISIKPGKYSRIADEDMSKLRLNKALMAGYGGADAPTSRVGGAVLQSEKLDDGRGGFKYITCDGCGAENVYMKHQVKCRTCGNHYPFDKLARFIVKD